MEYKRLFIFIEGDDDERFFQRIIKPRHEEKYHSVTLWKYAHKKIQQVESFLRSVKSMNADYIYVVDINRAPCVTGKKQEIQHKCKSIDDDRIIVVIREIESWYLAGLDATSSRQFGMPLCHATDDITKEQFNHLIPKKFDSRIDFMVEILNRFSIETAKQKNRSFRYFLGKHNCEV